MACPYDRQNNIIVPQLERYKDKLSQKLAPPLATYFNEQHVYIGTPCHSLIFWVVNMLEESSEHE